MGPIDSLSPQLSEVNIISRDLVLFTRRRSCASQPELQQQRRLNGNEASDLSVIMAKQDAAVSGGHSISYSISCQGAVMAGGGFPQQVAINKSGLIY